MSDVAKSDLTAEEKAKPYSKYFYAKPAVPDPKKLAVMEKPMDPAKALQITRINDMLNPGYFDVEAGWCVMPDGSAYIANYTQMPGVTPEMFKWWFVWHSLEPLRYKIWWPDGHFDVFLSDKDRAKVLDQGRTLDEKLQGLTHFVIENVGGPCAEKIAISWMTPESIGFDMERFKSPNVVAMVAANGVSLMLAPPPDIPNFKSPAFMMHFVREIKGGIELRTRFWMGYHILNKRPFLLIPKGVRLPDSVPHGLAVHNVFEFTNLASFLPGIYDEQKGLIT
jgi:phloretin hydrolase